MISADLVPADRGPDSGPRSHAHLWLHKSGHAQSGRCLIDQDVWKESPPLESPEAPWSADEWSRWSVSPCASIRRQDLGSKDSVHAQLSRKSRLSRCEQGSGGRGGLAGVSGLQHCTGPCRAPRTPRWDSHTRGRTWSSLCARPCTCHIPPVGGLRGLGPGVVPRLRGLRPLGDQLSVLTGSGFQNDVPFTHSSRNETEPRRKHCAPELNQERASPPQVLVPA